VNTTVSFTPLLAIAVTGPLNSPHERSESEGNEISTIGTEKLELLLDLYIKEPLRRVPYVGIVVYL
jgi:hypothetical protein